MPKNRRPFDRPSPARAELHAHIRENLGLGLGLGPYLRRIAQASVAAAMLSACSMSHGGGPDGSADTSTPDTSTDGGRPDAPDTRPPDTMPPPPPPSVELCGDDGVYRAVHGLDPVTTPTWLGAAGGAEFGGLPYVVDEIGERCGDARLPADCIAEVDRVVNESYQRSLITTEADVVGVHVTPEDINAFVGEVNNVKEAALLVWHAGYEIFCSGDFTSSVTRVEDGYRVIAYRSGGGCGSPWTTTRYTLGVFDGSIIVEDSVVVAEEEDFGCIGRRPAGLTGDMSTVTTGVLLGDYFANVARLEESAVAAFDVMIAELETLGAPEALLAAAAAAREDEVRHTASMSALATEFGAAPLRPVVEEVATRTPFEIALENAVEGCVRETFGALVGAHQALRASDPRIGAAMREVADDEIRHAELSWAVAGWLEPQLTESERAQIAAAQRDAIMLLREQASEPVDPELIARAGVPDPATAVRMVEQLATDIWA